MCQAWALHVFDNLSDENYIQNMTLLLDAAPKLVHLAGPSLTAAEPTIGSQDPDPDPIQNERASLCLRGKLYFKIRISGLN